MLDLDEAFMVDVIEMFQLPSDMKRYMYRPGSDSKSRGDIAFQ